MKIPVSIQLVRSPHRYPPDRDPGQCFWEGSLWLRVEVEGQPTEWWRVQQKSLHKARAEILEALSLVSTGQEPFIAVDDTSNED